MSKTKQAILRAIAIKLEVETHKKYRKFMAKLAWLAFVLFLALGLYNSVNRYLLASTILSDVVYVEASVEETPNNDLEKASTYHYRFDVQGNTYEDSVVASYKSIEKYMGSEGFKIAYKKSDPSLFGIAYRIEKNSTIGGIIKHFFMMFFFGGFGIMVINLFLTQGIVQPTEEYDDEDENEEQSTAP